MSNYFDRPSIRIVDPINGTHIMKKLEKCARTCYQSEGKEHKTSTEEFLKGIIKSGHTSVLEHESITIDLITNRGVLAELTRHRIGVGYSVESTRYVNYEKGVHFILPIEYDFEWTNLPIDKKLETRRLIFKESVETSAYAYEQLIKNGAKPQEARSVLPQALKVNMKVTMNIRAWRHFFELRCASGAHPDIKEIAIALLLYFRKKMLPLFEDIKYDAKFYEKYQNRIDRIIETPKSESDALQRELQRRMQNDSIPTGKKLDKSEDNVDKIKERHQNKIDDMEQYIENITKYADEIDKRRQDRINKMTAAMNTEDDDDEYISLDEALNKLDEVFEKWDKSCKKPKVECFHIDSPEDVTRLMKHLFEEE